MDLALIVAVIVVIAFLLLNRGFRPGQMPGDISTRRGPVRVYAPLASSLVVSLILSIGLTLLLNFALCTPR